jgi:hypothetical protein
MLHRRIFMVMAAFLIVSTAAGIVWRRSAWQRTFNRHKALIAASPWAGARPLYILIGDSHIEAGKWETLCPGPYGLRNCGLGGSKFEHVQEIVGIIPDQNVEGVLLMCGINNIGRGESADSTFNKFTSLLPAIREKLHPKRIVVASVMPIHAADEKSRKINAVIADFNSRVKGLCATSNAPFVDVSPLVAKPDGGLSEKLTSDGLHLNDQGYRAIASSLCQSLTQK